MIQRRWEYGRVPVEIWILGAASLALGLALLGIAMARAETVFGEVVTIDPARNRIEIRPLDADGKARSLDVLIDARTKFRMGKDPMPMSAADLRPGHLVRVTYEDGPHAKRVARLVAITGKAVSPGGERSRP